LGGDPDRALELDVEDVTHGGVHKWEEHFFISVGGLDPEGWPESLREQRERTAEEMAAVHERWRGTNFSFDELYRTELEAVGKTVLQIYVDEARRRGEALERGELDLEVLLPSGITRLVDAIHASSLGTRETSSSSTSTSSERPSPTSTSPWSRPSTAPTGTRPTQRCTNESTGTAEARYSRGPTPDSGSSRTRDRRILKQLKLGGQIVVGCEYDRGRPVFYTREGAPAPPP
jgi:hypothetical protein